MKKRLFVAIPLPETLRSAFGAYQEKNSVLGVRWTAPENFHFTVYFIGWVEENLAPKIKDALGRVCANTKPFPLVLEEIRFAPPACPARMIWAVFLDQGKLKELTDAVYDGLNEYAPCDNRPRENIVHITLARFKDPGITRGITLNQLSPTEPIEVRTLNLMQSTLARSGPIYTVRSSFPFGMEGTPQ